MRLATRKSWIFLGVLGVAVVLAVGWALLLSPAQSQIDSINSQTTQQLAQNAQTADQISKLEKQLPQLPAAEAELAALEVSIPSSPQIPQVLLDLNGLAASSGTTLGAITPSAAVSVAAPAGGGKKAAAAATGLMRVPLAITVTGTYDAVQRFVLGLERTPRTVLVSSVTVDPLGAEPGAAAQFTGNIGAFIYYDQRPAAASSAAPGSTASTTTPTPAPSATASGDPALDSGS